MEPTTSFHDVTEAFLTPSALRVALLAKDNLRGFRALLGTLEDALILLDRALDQKIKEQRFSEDDVGEVERISEMFSSEFGRSINHGGDFTLFHAAANDILTNTVRNIRYNGKLSHLLISTGTDDDLGLGELIPPACLEAAQAFSS